MLPASANIHRSATAFPVPGSQFTSQLPPSAFMPLPEVQQNKAEEAVPIRPPASAHMLLDSLDRYPNQFATLQQVAAADAAPGNDFKISSQEAIIYGYFTRLAITQAYLKYNIPTVVDASNNPDAPAPVVGNNTFAIQQTGGAVLGLAIPQGFYTPQSLAVTINGLLAGSAAPYNTYTCAFNNLTNSLQILSNNGQTFFVTPTILPNNAQSPGKNTTLRCKYLLGISGSNIGPANAAVVQNFGPPRMYYTSFVDIVSQRLTKYQRVKDSESGASINRRGFQTLPAIQNVVARVYLTPPNQRTFDLSGGPCPGSAPVDIVVDYNTPKHIRWSSEEAVYELDFQLYDQYGEPLFWTPKYNTEFVLTMLASET